MKATKFLVLCAACMSLCMASCSGGSTTDEPDVPTPVKPGDSKIEEFDVKIGFNVDLREENTARTAGSRAEIDNSKDLIGVSILHLSNNQWGGKSPVQYAYGVFDDVNSIIFKLQKDQLYMIQMTYYPDAKNIVYKYTDGSYGVPFNDPYVSKPAYVLNEAKYHSENNPGFQQIFVLKNIYQDTAENDFDKLCKRGITPLYMGVKEVTLSQQQNIEIQLENCLMGLKFNCSNFTEGTLMLEYESPGDHRVVEFKPGDVLEDWVQIVIPYVDYYANSGNGTITEGGDNIKLYYKSPNEQRYLLATKYLPWKTNTNYVFTFDLKEREDGSIGILMPSADENEDVQVEFD